MTDLAVDIGYCWEPRWKARAMSDGMGSGTRHAPPEKYRVPKYDFVVGNHRIIPSKPVQVTVYKDEDYFVACSETLHIFAAAESAQSAIQDFSEQVVHFYFHYRERPENSVTGLAARVKAIFAQHFHEE